MIYNLAHEGNKLISFTIGGITYYAEDGMTWEEWVNSEYNTDGYLSLNTVSTAIIATSKSNTVSGEKVYKMSGPVYPTDKIIAGQGYSLEDYDFS